MTTKPTTTEALPELLPCPFDGSTATRMRVVSGHWLVECDSCGVSTPHDGFCDPDKVWNTRTPSPTPSSAEARDRGPSWNAVELAEGLCNPAMDCMKLPAWRAMVTEIAAAIDHASTPQPTLQQAIDCVREMGQWCDGCPHKNAERNEDGSCSAYGYNGVDCQSQPCVCRFHTPKHQHYDHIIERLSSLSAGTQETHDAD